MIALSIDPLLDVPTPPRRVTVYRTVLLHVDGTPAEDFVPDPSFAKADAGRWATDAGTLYTAPTEEVAWCEYCRWNAKDLALFPPTGCENGVPQAVARRMEYEPIGPPPPEKALVRLEFELRSVPDLTLQRVRSKVFAAGLAPEAIRGDDHAPCQDFAKLAERAKWDAMIVPSAGRAEGGTCIPIFQAGRERLIDETVVAARGSPSILHAFDTRYRAGERPAWLRFV
jgi:hypothetical protein